MMKLAPTFCLLSVADVIFIIVFILHHASCIDSVDFNLRSGFLHNGLGNGGAAGQIHT
jgi:hypothetical protein